ncbi:MAG: hypothetical protein ABI760_11680 [Ferruginibacter sp.]
MKNFLLFTICALLISKFAFSQDSMALQKPGTPNPYAAVSLIIIKGEEFRRFPSGSFLDAVNGLFPWVFSLAADANNFLFVVNGFLTPDINSISLYDIEEVSFMRNNLNGSLYPFSKAGTFYITTHKFAAGKAVFSFNTQYNIIRDKDGYMPSTTTGGIARTQSSKNKVGYLLSTHASALAGGKKWELYVSAQLDKLTTPKGRNTTVSTYTGINLKDSTLINSIQKQLNFRSFAQFSYRFSSKLQFGITGSYFHGTTNRDTTSSGYYTDGTVNAVNEIRSTLPFYHTGAFGYWAPLPKLSIRVSIEYAADRLNDNNEYVANILGFGNPDHTSTSTAETVLHSNRFLLRNELKYNFISGPKFQSGFSTVFSYLQQKQNYNYSAVSKDGYGGTAARGSTINVGQKLTSLNPGFYFSLHKIFSGYAGYAFLLNKGISRFTAASKSNPYAGIVFDIKNIFNAGDKLNRFDLSLEYGDLTRNNANNNWLPAVANPSQFFPSPVLGFTISPFNPSTFPNSSLANIFLKNRLITIQVNTALFNNRLAVGAEWSKLQSEYIYNYLTNFGGSVFSVNVKDKESQKGAAAYLAAKMIDQPAIAWTIRLNVLFLPPAGFQLNATINPAIISLKDQFQAGLQNKVSYKKWYAQLNGLMALNNKKVNSFLLNYLLAGYGFSGESNRLLNKVSLFVQARNLISSGPSKDYYGYFTYGGAGISLIF